MKRLFIILICAAMAAKSLADGPDSIRLDQCLAVASEKSALARQKGISEEILNDRLTNLKSNWYPSVGLNAQASYNSETVEFSDLLQNLPVSIPSLPLDQYKIWADINQQLFDGGMVKALKQVEKAGYKSEIYQTEAELLAIRMQVSQVFFSLLLTQNNTETIGSSLNLLEARKNALKAGVSNGVVLPENLLAMEAEEISLRQKLTELRLQKTQLFRALSILTDSVFPDNSIVAEPEIPVVDQNGIRPEFLLFDMQKERLQANSKLIGSGDLPRVFAFSQLAYGRPGYNMVSRDFHTFYTVGAGMKWNFLNYGDTRRQKRIIGLQQQLVDVKRTNFDVHLRIQLQAELTNLEKYDSLMKQDQAILSLRKSIAGSSLSRLNNGIITSADYLDDMNAELLAELQYGAHRILRKQAEYNYLILQGKLNFNH